MKNYDKFAAFYDAVMGDRKASTDQLIKFVRSRHPGARTVLELGCGTGSVLERLGMRYELNGIDISSRMLAIARKKVPRAALSRQDMASFSFSRKFDLIFCVFDSINHLLKFADWKRTFSCVGRHLAEQGVFIFDINTRKKLERLIAAPPWFHPFGANYLVMKVSDAGRGISDWNIKVFERIKRNQYALHEETIKEASFPEKEIVRALNPHFQTVEVIDIDRDDPSKSGERLYFICKN